MKMLGGKKKAENVVDNKTTKQVKQEKVQKIKEKKKTANAIDVKEKKRTINAKDVKVKKKSVNTKDVKAKKDKKIQDIHRMTIIKGIHDNIIDYGSYFGAAIEIPSIEFRFFSVHRRSNSIDVATTMY